LLEPQFISLMYDDEQHFVMGGLPAFFKTFGKLGFDDLIQLKIGSVIYRLLLHTDANLRKLTEFIRDDEARTNIVKSKIVENNKKRIIVAATWYLSEKYAYRYLHGCTAGYKRRFRYRHPAL